MSFSRRQILGNATIWSAAGLALMGCGGTPSTGATPQTATWTPISLAVQAIEIGDRSLVESDLDFIARRRIDELRASTLDYLTKRFLSVGGDVNARATITEARVVERPLPTTGGITGLVTSQADAELEAQLMVEIAIIDFLGVQLDSASARVARSRKLSNSLGVIERDAIAKQMMGDIIDQLDESLRQAVDVNLGQYLAV